MRVLLINQYFPPDTSATAAVHFELAQALVRAGHSVLVVSGRPSYRPTTRRPWRPWRHEVEEGLEVLRLGSSAFNRERLGGRVANYLTYLVLVCLGAPLLGRADVAIVGSDPPLAVLVASLTARYRALVYNLQDLHPDAAAAGGMVVAGKATRLWERIHRSAMKRCDLIVCLGTLMGERVVDKGLARDRVAVIPLGAPDAVGVPDPKTVAELRAGSDMCLVHAGNLGLAGPWAALAEASRALENVRFVFVGEGVYAEKLRRSGAVVRPFFPVEQLASVMAAGDLQIVAQRADMAGLVVPSKVFTAIAHSRPILAVVPEESEVAHLVRMWDCGVVADPDDPQDVISKVSALRQRPERVAEMGRNASRAAKEVSRTRSLEQWVSVVETFG